MEPPPPPPPYSETDIYSVSSGHHAFITPSTSVADNASVAGARPALSTASSIDEPIYTPPYSPASSFHQNQVVGEEELENASTTTSSAAAFFASRPVRFISSSPAPAETHKLIITSTTEPKDLQYPQSLLAKDVNQQDWATFVNYLIPDHIATVNNDVADRKLKAEMIDERLHKFNLGPDDVSRGDPSEVDAQLSPLRNSQAPPNAARLSEAKATVSEWNENFFGPRGVQICLADADESVNQMPGAWIPSETEIGAEGSRSAAVPETRRTWGPFGGFRTDGEGFRMGSVVADNGGFRIGNMLVADQNGFRLGGRRGFVADSHGVSLGGRTFGPGPTRNLDEFEPRRGRHGHHGPHRGRSHSHGWRGKGKGRARSKSSDSSSSSSSSSSSESAASVGSLPEYEDLRDQQLPIAKQSLLEWLNHPDQPLTKEAVQNMKQEFKAARRDPSSPMAQDMTVLRKEVKDLLKSFKELKKAQKKQRREEKRTRRAAKRAAKKERRLAKKEARNLKNQERACGGRQGPRSRGRGMRGPGSPTMPGFMPTGSGPHCIPGMPPMPSMPPMPGAFPSMEAGYVPSFMNTPHFGRGHAVPPGMAARHGGWPFARSLSNNSPFSFGMPGSYIPSFGPGAGAEERHREDEQEHGEISATSAEQMYAQATHLDTAADMKEEQATTLRTEATGRGVGEKERLKMLDEATRLEEESERERREAGRLRVEATHLDEELARELHEEHSGY